MADDDNDDDMVPRSHIRQLEQDAKDAKELKVRFAEMERRTAFSEALGTAAVDPKNRYFIKGYDGELTPDAIRAEAEAAGLLNQSTPSPPADLTNNNPTPQEMAAHARMAAAAEGAGGNKPVDLIDAFGPRGSKTPDELIAMSRAAGLRMVEDQQ